MKKLLVVIIAVIAVLTVSAAGVFAANTGSADVSAVSDGIRACSAAGECINREQCGRNYEDDNNDGICDNYTGGSYLRERAGHHGNGCGNGCWR